MSDLISRQAAIDALDTGCELLRRVLDNTDVVGVERAKYEWSLGLIESCIADMKALPSAQPEQDREFIKLTVRNSNGKPYYSIIYLEVDDNGVGHDFEGYSSYSLNVISDYLKQYFMPTVDADLSEYSDKLWKLAYERGKRDALAERTGKWIKGANHGLGVYTLTCDKCGYVDVSSSVINFCPHCGCRMMKEGEEQ